MNDSTLDQFELHFLSLCDSGRAYAFPCNSEGKVDLDQLSDRARNNYLYARAVSSRCPSYAARLCVRPLDGSPNLSNQGE